MQNVRLISYKSLSEKDYVLQQITKRALIYESLDHQMILKYYLLDRIQVDNTALRSTLLAQDASVGYLLVKRYLPKESILVEVNNQKQYLLLHKLRGRSFLQEFPLSQTIIKNLLCKLQEWDRAGLFHNTLTSENIIIIDQEQVALVDFDDVFLSNKLIKPSSNLLNFLLHTVHNVILSEEYSLEVKVLFLERLSAEFKHYEWDHSPILDDLFATEATQLYTVFQFVGGLLSLIFDVATNLLHEPKLGSKVMGLVESLADEKFDLISAVSYLSLFLSLDAEVDAHKRGLLNPITILTKPTMFLFASSRTINKYADIMTIWLNWLQEKEGQVMIVSDDFQTIKELRKDLLNRTTNVEFICLETSSISENSPSLLLSLQSIAIPTGNFPWITTVQIIDDLFRLQVIV